MAVTTARRKAHAPSAQQQVAQRRVQAKQQGASLPAYLQRKLSLGQVGDAYEVEADHVADQVVAAGNASPALESGPTAQRVPADEKKQDAKKPDEKAQKAEADKKDAKKPDQKPAAQKAEADKKEAKKPDEKKDQKPAVQKKEVNADAKIADEKKKLGPGAEAKAANQGLAPADHEPAAASEKAPEKQQAAQAAQADKPGADQKKKDDKPAAAQTNSLASGITRVQAQSLQTKADAGGSVAGDVEHRIDATRGGGAPLPANTRGEMESQFGTDFGNVNIHTGSEAQSLSSDLNAKAFTVGNDVYFNNGAFAPETQEGKHLLAHELTHVVQQGGGESAQRRVQRGPTAPAAAPAGPAGASPAASSEEFTATSYKGPLGEITIGTDGSPTAINIATLQIPAAKTKGPVATPASVELSSAERGETKQASNWNAAIGDLSGQVNDVITRDKGADLSGTVYFKIGGQKRYLIGSRSDVAKKFANPFWSPTGKATSYEIDHSVELQMGGNDDTANLWLLEGWINGQCGVTIKGNIYKALGGIMTAANIGDKALWKGKKPPKVADVRYGPKITVGKVTFDGAPDAGAGSFYKPSDITSAKEHIKPLKAMTEQQVKDDGLPGTKDSLSIFTSRAGGSMLKVPWGEGKTNAAIGKEWVRGVTADSLTFDVGSQTGSITVTLFKPKGKKGLLKPVTDTLPIEKMDGIPFGGAISDAGVRGMMKRASVSVEGWSPITFSDAAMGDDGLSAKGKLKISVPALEGIDVDLVLSGDEIALQKTFTADEFSLPGPVQVNGCSLTIGVGTNGVSATGDVMFSIERVGKGVISATASTKAGGTCSLHGEFQFDPKLVDEGLITLDYKEGKLSGTGKLGIKEGRIKGIKSAKASIAVDDKKWNATGSVEPDVPGIDHADLSIAFDPDKGMKVSGDLFLKKMPGISDGKLSAELLETGDRWKLKASGTVNLAIPDLPASITATYDDGAFTASLTVAYAKGMLKGSLVVGLTNQAVGDDGKPAGDPGDDLTVFGSGSMTIQVAPWLQGTVAITLLPTGKLKVYGEVALPSTLDVFPEKRFDKELLSIGIDIPIVGVSVAGQRVGIFATIGGNVKLMAGVGPGQLRNVKLGIDYTPGEEDKTHVTGSAEMHVPADAGLRLAITGGIGAGIPIVSATAGLEIGAFAGVKAEANVGTTVDWTPTKGLVLEGKAEAKAQPAFAFDVTGFVKVEADLLVKTINLYEKRWQLAAFEYGSGMELGIELPLRYEEGKPFNPSIEDVKFTYPDIDPMGMLGGLIDKL